MRCARPLVLLHGIAPVYGRLARGRLPEEESMGSHAATLVHRGQGVGLGRGHDLLDRHKLVDSVGHLHTSGAIDTLAIPAALRRSARKHPETVNVRVPGHSAVSPVTSRCAAMQPFLATPGTRVGDLRCR